MTPDPVFDKLARFTPAAGLDPADLLFRAGRASARTPRAWKLTVAGLLLTNAVAVGLLLVPTGTPPPPLPETVIVPVVVPVAAPLPAPASPPPASPSPWSVGALHRTTDPDDLPRVRSADDGPPPRAVLTPRDALRDID